MVLRASSLIGSKHNYIVSNTKRKVCESMPLTKFERRLLINQYQILKALGNDEEDNGERYDKFIEILESGYEYFYDEVIGKFEPEMARNESEFVFQVLEMFRGIENYKKQHSDDAEVINHTNSHFLGFDANNEGEHYSFARFLIKTWENYQEQMPYEERTGGFNSHMPVIPLYQRMLETLSDLKITGRFSREQVLAILNSGM